MMFFVNYNKNNYKCIKNTEPVSIPIYKIAYKKCYKMVNLCKKKV